MICVGRNSPRRDSMRGKRRDVHFEKLIRFVKSDIIVNLKCDFSLLEMRATSIFKLQMRDEIIYLSAIRCTQVIFFFLRNLERKKNSQRVSHGFLRMKLIFTKELARTDYESLENERPQKLANPSRKEELFTRYLLMSDNLSSVVRAVRENWPR